MFSCPLCIFLAVPFPFPYFPNLIMTKLKQCMRWCIWYVLLADGKNTYNLNDMMENALIKFYLAKKSIEIDEKRWWELQSLKPNANNLGKLEKYCQ